MIRIKSLHLGKSLETIGLNKIAFLRFLGCQNRFMIYTVPLWFWQHQTIQKFAVDVKIASWFVKSFHDFDSIRLCKICCCCHNRLLIREIASWFWQYQTMQKSIIFQNHLTSSPYKNPSFFPKLFTTQSYNQKQKFNKLISTQPYQHFTLIYQESQFTMNDPFSSKLLKQQLHKMEHPWYN